MKSEFQMFCLGMLTIAVVVAGVGAVAQYGDDLPFPFEAGGKDYIFVAFDGYADANGGLDSVVQCQVLVVEEREGWVKLAVFACDLWNPFQGEYESISALRVFGTPLQVTEIEEEEKSTWWVNTSQIRSVTWIE